MITLPHTLASTSTSNPAPAAQQQQTLATDLSDLSRNDVGDFFKQLRLRHYVEQIIAQNEQAGVTTDVSIIDMQMSKQVVAHNLDTEHFAASINKLPVAQLLLAGLRDGSLQMDTVLTWTADDVRAGAGVYDQPGAPLQATVHDLLFDMLNRSGNTAVRVFVNGALGGATQVNNRITNELHLQHTYLQPLDATHFYLGNSTSRDAMQTTQQVLRIHDTYGAFMKNAMATNIYTDYGVRSQLGGNDYIVLANKVGILDDPTGNNRHDVGIIYNMNTHKAYAYAFMTTASGAATDPATTQANASLGEMGKGVLRYAGDRQQTSGASPRLKHQTVPESKLKY